MKVFFYKVLHSFPIQLLLLHCRHYQVLLLFWVVLFSTLENGFARSFGAASLFLAPEYLGQVSFSSTFILGFAFGIFIMSWHITTFILHSKRFYFLATTNHPFAKYCFNNSIIPLAFLLFFAVESIHYQRYNELYDWATIGWISIGFLTGLFLVLFLSFTYFFRANRTILRAIQKKMGGPRKLLAQIMTKEAQVDENALKVDNYFNSAFRLKRARNVDHYNRHFLESIFRRHHFAAVLTIGIAFVFLIIMGYLTEYAVFRIPAGASVLLFFSVLIGFSGAFTYILGSWSIPLIVLILLVINTLIRHDILDTRSKAYGLDYLHKSERPVYSIEAFNKLFTPAMLREDEDSTIRILERWRAKFPPQDKPRLVVINVSGGGSRSAVWCMDVLQYADSLLGGTLMQQSVLITGASGGMIGAAYYRELYLEKMQGKNISPNDPRFADNVGKDMLNAVFSSFAVNDFFTPFQAFHIGRNKYAKDRGYAFERQINLNLDGSLNKTLAEYGPPERAALIPLLIFNSTITADGRRMLISPQPVSYLTMPLYPHVNRNVNDIDGIDFCRFFARQHPQQLRFTSAIRMSATFPYVLPNVYLPTRPIVDAMDAGLRDNYGQETSLRFLHVFRNWINENTSGIVFIQIRDSRKNEIHDIEKQKDLGDIVLEPLFTIQRNWSSVEDYYQDDLIAYAQHFLKVPFDRLIFQYVPRQENKGAALNWHLTMREKQDIREALHNPANQSAFHYLQKLLKK